MVHTAATGSLAQAACNERATVLDLLEADKSLRFLKSNADAPLRFHKLCNSMDSLRVGVYTDASWGSRPDGASQGGVAIFLIGEECLREGSACPLVILDWSSKNSLARAEARFRPKARAPCMQSTRWSGQRSS